MALSYYSNWPGTILAQGHHFNPDMNFVPQLQLQLQPELELLPQELLVFNDNYTLSDTCLDPLFEPPPDHIFYSENCTSNDLLPSPNPQFSVSSLIIPAETFTHDPQEEFEPFPHHQKHQKTYHDTLTTTYQQDFTSASLYNWFVPNPPVLLPQELCAPLPEFQGSPPVYNAGTNDSAESDVKKITSGGSLSVQSIAARQRRRKIAEKTQELGKLIPGGQRMNTAEMFQAAFKYIKFLQAQVGLHQCIASFQEGKDEKVSRFQEFQALVESPLIQEKLYSNEKCLAPRKLLQTLEEDDRLQTSPMLLKHVNQLIHTDGQ